MRGWQPDYLSKHDDVEADAIGLDECAVLSASEVIVVLGKPGGREQVRGKGTAVGNRGRICPLGPGPVMLEQNAAPALRPGSIGTGQRSALPAEQMTPEHLGASPGSCVGGPRSRKTGLLTKLPTLLTRRPPMSSTGTSKCPSLLAAEPPASLKETLATKGMSLASSILQEADHSQHQHWTSFLKKRTIAPSMDEWINVLYIHATKCYLAIKRDEVLINATTCINL